MQELQENQNGKLTITNCRLLDIKSADIIVNSAMAKANYGNPGSVDYAIYAAAGIEMLNERKSLGNAGYLSCSECVSTNSYALKKKGIKRIIHVNVPSYFRNRNALVDTYVKLIECYYNALYEAISYKDGPHTVAFPLLGMGAKGFKYPAAVGLMQIGVSSFFSYYPDAQVNVIVSIIDPTAFQYAEHTCIVHSSVLINCKYEYHSSQTSNAIPYTVPEQKLYEDLRNYREQLESANTLFQQQREQLIKAATLSWERDEHTLGGKILHYESLSGLSRKELINLANISSTQYNDIVNKPHHNCSFNSVVGLCIAFDLTLEQSIDLLKSARMAFDDYDQGCQIIIRGIENRKLSPKDKRDQINEELFNCDISYVHVGNPR